MGQGKSGLGVLACKYLFTDPVHPLSRRPADGPASRNEWVSHMTTTRDIAGWIGVLKVKVQAMQAEMVRLEKLAANHRINFERERDRAGQLVDELLQMTATAMHAEAEKKRLEGEIAALRSRSLWQQLVG